jgi:hypothetical protein
MNKQEYNRIMGLTSEDIGSRKLLLKKLLPKFKKKSPAYNLKVKQLKAIYQKLN